jgi:hypothetical protein
MGKQFRVVQKADYLTGATIYSVQEWVANQFCGHWLEIDWALNLGDANALMERVS